jgi:ribosomal protein S18 acetylase RimI-like enzyme
MPVEIQQAPSDFTKWDELLALIHCAFAFQHSRIDPPSSLHKLDPVSLAKKAHEETLFLAIEHGLVVGCVFAKSMGKSLYVGKFAVSPKRQGQGIGRRLLEAAEALARRMGLDAVELETRIELTENHEAFRAMGFAKTSEHAHPGYSRSTSITMRKLLGHAEHGA